MIHRISMLFVDRDVIQWRGAASRQVTIQREDLAKAEEFLEKHLPKLSVQERVAQVARMRLLLDAEPFPKNIFRSVRRNLLEGFYRICQGISEEILC